MRDALCLWRRLWKAEAGATAIEYCLIAALIAVLTISGIVSLGGSMGFMFTKIASTVGPGGGP